MSDNDFSIQDTYRKIVFIYCRNKNWDARTGAWFKLTNFPCQTKDIDPILAVYRAADAVGNSINTDYKGFCSIWCYDSWINEHKELVVIEMAKI